jgi:hypothetical protein
LNHEENRYSGRKKHGWESEGGVATMRLDITRKKRQPKFNFGWR